MLNRENDNAPALWTNEMFAGWLKTVNLQVSRSLWSFDFQFELIFCDFKQVYEDNLSESGLHGGLILDNSFNADYVNEALRIDETKVQANRKFIEEEIKALKKSKTWVAWIVTSVLNFQ